MASADRQPPVTRASEYVRADWERYRRLTSLVNHWDRPGWNSGRRSYHWIVRFDDDPAVRRLAARCQQHLRHLPTLDLVPAAGLHLTVQRVAFTDEISISDAHAIADAAHDRYAALPVVTAMVGPLAGSSGAVRFSVGPHQPLRRIRETARDAIAQVRGADAVPARATDFVPHVSIAYNSRPTEARPIIQQVAMLRSLESVMVRIGAIDLVELRRDGRQYVWERIISVPLGGPPALDK